jgi:hypothetical protein
MNMFAQHQGDLGLKGFRRSDPGSGDVSVWKDGAAFKVAMIAVTSFLLVWGWLAVVLQFPFMGSDVAGYWGDSLAWRTPFNPDHVPGYPLLIALLRFLTPASIEPIVLFWAVTFCAHIAGALAVYWSVASRADERVGYFSVILFLLWPFVGTTYVAFPFADSVALALIACGFALLLSERFRTAAMLLGLAMVVHKASWIFAILLLVAGVLTHRRRFPWTAAVIMACPLGSLWVAGMIVNGYGPLWLLSVSLPIQFASKSSLPVFDGLIGTLLKGGTKDFLKSTVLWTQAALLFGLALAIVYGRGFDRSTKWWALAIIGGLIFLYSTLNQDIIWAAVRYSKLAALPFGLYIGSRPRIANTLMRSPWISAGLVLLLFATQLAFCWYMAEIKFADDHTRTILLP